MKTIKMAVLLTTISLFTLTSYNAAVARDCSNPKGFHQKLMCKVSGSSNDSVTTEETIKKDGGFMTKLKQFLGKKNSN